MLESLMRKLFLIVYRQKIGHRHEGSSHGDDPSERTQSVLSGDTHKVFYHLTMRSVSAVQFFGEQKECLWHSFRGNGPPGHLLTFPPDARKNSRQKAAIVYCYAINNWS